MALVKDVKVNLTADDKDAKAKLDDISLKADELGKKDPSVKVKVDIGEASAKLAVLREELKSVGNDASGGGKGGFLSSLFSGGGGAGGGLSSLFSGGMTSPAGIAGIGAAVAAALPELSALVTGFAAAGAGVAGFGALAIPTFSKIKNAYTGIQTAQDAYNKAAAMNKQDPTKANATAAAKALQNLKLAEDQMSPSTKTAVKGIQDLVSTYEGMAKAFAPDAMKVFNSALKIANTLLPDLKPFADQAAGAINGLLGKVSTFFKSADFRKWLGTFSQYVGPSITAIGTGIGKVAVAIGKLLTGMSVKDVVHGIATAFDILAGAINAVTWTVKALMKGWDGASTAFEVAAGAILGFFSQVILGAQRFADDTLGAFGAVIHGARVAADFLGIHTLDSIDNTFQGIRKSVHDNLQTAADNLQQWARDMSNAPKVFHLRGDITDLQAKLATGLRLLKDPNLTKTRRAAIEANDAQLLAAIARDKAEIASLQGKTIYIDTVNTTSYRYAKNITGHAAGGPASGLSLVGEAGPELVSLPQGSFVHTAQQTKSMMGNHYTININALVASRDTGRQVVEAIKQFEQGSGASWRTA